MENQVFIEFRLDALTTKELAGLMEGICAEYIKRMERSPITTAEWESDVVYPSTDNPTYTPFPTRYRQVDTYTEHDTLSAKHDILKRVFELVNAHNMQNKS